MGVTACIIGNAHRSGAYGRGCRVRSKTCWICRACMFMLGVIEHNFSILHACRVIKRTLKRVRVGICTMVMARQFADRQLVLVLTERRTELGELCNCRHIGIRDLGTAYNHTGYTALGIRKKEVIARAAKRISNYIEQKHPRAHG